MQKRSGKATISMRGNSNRLPDLFFKELVVNAIIYLIHKREKYQ